jgi:hypothetical protein
MIGRCRAEQIGEMRAAKWLALRVLKYSLEGEIPTG